MNGLEKGDKLVTNKSYNDNIGDNISEKAVKLKRIARKKRELKDLEEIIDDVENFEVSLLILYKVFFIVLRVR